jgi:hypothetical protein
MSVARNANQHLMLTGTPLQNDLHVCITYVANIIAAMWLFFHLTISCYRTNYWNNLLSCKISICFGWTILQCYLLRAFLQT